MSDTTVLTFAYITDILIGDPRWVPHPVRSIGRAITFCEKFIRRCITGNSPTAERIAGAVLAVIIPLVTYAVFALLVFALERSSLHLVSAVIMIFLTASSLATRELIRSAAEVIDGVMADDLETARNSLSMIVGRDTRELNRKSILRAVIETLAENASDGIVAPIFYFVIGGLPLAMAYKAVNTLDSMVGYKNDKYRDLGWASARLDDIFSYIPARLTGLLIVAATFLSGLFERSGGFAGENALKIMMRDGRKHASPNSGIPEAAMAGALGIRLGGPSKYGRILIEKPYIGEDGPGAVHTEDGDFELHASIKAKVIVKITSILCLVVALTALQMGAYLL